MRFFLMTEKFNNCKTPVVPAVPITDEEFRGLCLESHNGRQIRFRNCISTNIQQQWVIWKTENDRNSIRICQRVDDRSPNSLISYNCLTALHTIESNLYQFFVRIPIKPNDEARYLMLDYQGFPSQEWQMNKTSHQLASVQYPKVCMTTRHYNNPADILLLECNGYGYESPNPQLNKHQRFYFKLALDKSGEHVMNELAPTFSKSV